MEQAGLYATYDRYLPDSVRCVGIDLGQGFTPVVRSRSIGPKAGLGDLWFKLETQNPTGSYKDRFAGLAVGALSAAGKDRCVATSSGNTGAALAGFAAAAGIRCALYVSENAPAGKLSQMLAYGAEVYPVDKFTIDAEESARITEVLTKEAEARGLTIYITAYAVSPDAMEGIKTIAYEIHDDLGPVNDVFLPVGGGGLFMANARGFADLVADGTLEARPRLHAVQPAGNDTVVTPIRNGAQMARPVSTSTRISGLGVGYVLDGNDVVQTTQATGGTGQLIDEDEIFEVQKRLAREEGLLVEPAGAVAVAGALQAAERGELDGKSRAVCILTGHGFKDPDSVQAMSQPPRIISRDDIPGTFGPDEQ